MHGARDYFDGNAASVLNGKSSHLGFLSADEPAFLDIDKWISFFQAIPRGLMRFVIGAAHVLPR